MPKRAAKKIRWGALVAHDSRLKRKSESHKEPFANQKRKLQRKRKRDAEVEARERLQEEEKQGKTRHRGNVPLEEESGRKFPKSFR